MSPRSTHALHEGCDLKHLAPVVFVSLKLRSLSGKRGPAPQPGSALTRPLHLERAKGIEPS